MGATENVKAAVRFFRFTSAPLIQARRGTWQPYTLPNGKITAGLICPVCARAVTLVNHKIDLDGNVTPLVRCHFVQSGHCTLRRASIMLLDWADYWSTRPN